MKDIRHESLKTHILDPCNDLGGFEIFICRVATTLAEIVN
jgi:hypothetical protein